MCQRLFQKDYNGLIRVCTSSLRHHVEDLFLISPALLSICLVCKRLFDEGLKMIFFCFSVLFLYLLTRVANTLVIRNLGHMGYRCAFGQGA